MLSTVKGSRDGVKIRQFRYLPKTNTWDTQYQCTWFGSISPLLSWVMVVQYHRRRFPLPFFLSFPSPRLLSLHWLGSPFIYTRAIPAFSIDPVWAAARRPQAPCFENGARPLFLMKFGPQRHKYTPKSEQLIPIPRRKIDYICSTIWFAACRWK